MHIKDYHALKNWGSSQAREILKSPKKGYYSMYGARSAPTAAMNQGSAVHSRIGEPESFMDVILYDNLHVFLWVGGLIFALRGNRLT